MAEGLSTANPPPAESVLNPQISEPQSQSLKVRGYSQLLPERQTAALLGFALEANLYLAFAFVVSANAV